MKSRLTKKYVPKRRYKTRRIKKGYKKQSRRSKRRRVRSKILARGKESEWDKVDAMPDPSIIDTDWSDVDAMPGRSIVVPDWDEREPVELQRQPIANTPPSGLQREKNPCPDAAGVWYCNHKTQIPPKQINSKRSSNVMQLCPNGTDYRCKFSQYPSGLCLTSGLGPDVYNTNSSAVSRYLLPDKCCNSSPKPKSWLETSPNCKNRQQQEQTQEYIYIAQKRNKLAQKVKVVRESYNLDYKRSLKLKQDRLKEINSYSSPKSETLDKVGLRRLNEMKQKRLQVEGAHERRIDFRLEQMQREMRPIKRERQILDMWIKAYDNAK